MADRHDYVALEWVKGEIAETLKQARQALEAYVENPQDASRLQFCQAYVHQVLGTLQMVEFYGAALLAEEMEQLLRALLEGRVSNQNEALEVLMQGVLQLPAYLERIQSARRDLPMILLPLLNDLRAARGDSLLSETSLFSPDLSSRQDQLPAEQLDSLRTAELQPLLRKLRQVLQLALVGVLRNQDMPSNLTHLARVFARLDSLCKNAPLGTLWAISAGLVEGLANGSVPNSAALRTLLRQVDRELKRLVEQGADGFNQPAPDELTKNLLFYVAKAEGESARLVELRERYRLEEALPDERLVDEERARMAGPDRAAMRSVVTALCEELVRIKDTLDIFVRSDRNNLTELDSLPAPLKQIADTLAVLGFGPQRKIILDQLDTLQSLSTRRQEASDAVLMDIAGALLYVEATLAGMAGPNEDGVNEDQQLPTTDVAQIHQLVIKEARTALEQAKDAIIEFIASQWNHEHLARAPELLTQARGGLAMIPLERAAGLLEICRRYIEEQLLLRKLVPNWQDLDTLADAITSVEYYLERLCEDHAAPGDLILDVAEESLESLGYSLKPQRSILDGLPSDLDLPSARLDAEPVSEHEVVEPQDSASALELEPELHSQHEPAVDAAIESDWLSTEVDLGAAASAEQNEPLTFDLEASTAASTPDSLELDDWQLAPIAQQPSLEAELEAPLTFELTDAAPVVEAPTELEQWQELPLASEPLAQAPELELSSEWGEFTLDEAANTPAESSWLLDKGIVQSESETAPSWLNESLDAPAEELSFDELQLPEVELPQPIEPQTITAPAPLTMAEVMAAPVQAINPPAQEVPPSLLPPPADEEPIDEELQEVFVEEVGEVLETLHEYFPKWRANSDDREALTEVRRAFHTLKGSGRMVRALVLGELAWSIENMLNRVLDRSIAADQPVFEVINGVLQLVPALVEEFAAKAQRQRDDVDVLAATAHALAKGQAVPKFNAPDSAKVIEAEGEQDAFLEFEANAEVQDDALGHAELAEPGLVFEPLSEVQEAAPQQPAPDSDESLDLQLLEIFSNEAQSHLETLQAFLAQCDHELPQPVTDDLQRALHTLKGSAHMAGILPVAEIAMPLEKLVKEFKANHLAIDLAETELLKEAEQLLRSGLATLAEQGMQPIAGSSEFLAKVERLHRERLNAQASAREQDHNASPEPQLIGHFLAEGMDILLDAESLLHSWREHPGQRQELGRLLGELAMLGQSAAEVGLEPVYALSQLLQDTYAQVEAGRLAVSEAFFEVATSAHEALIGMLDQLAAGLQVQPREDCETALRALLQTALPDQMLALLESGNDAVLVEEISAPLAEEDEPVAEAAVGAAPIEAEAPESAEPIELGELDIEMVEIFLEEAQDILESAHQALERWRAQPDNSAPLAGLQRDLHTLKGGARMAGIAPIGDLAHELESLYEGLVDGRYQPSETLLSLLQRCHDCLALQVDQLQSASALANPQALIAQILHWRNPALAAQTAVAQEAPVEPLAAAKLEPSEQISSEDWGDAELTDSNWQLSDAQPVLDEPLAGAERGELTEATEPEPLVELESEPALPEVEELTLELAPEHEEPGLLENLDEPLMIEAGEPELAAELLSEPLESLIVEPLNEPSVVQSNWQDELPVQPDEAPELAPELPVAAFDEPLIETVEEAQPLIGEPLVDELPADQVTAWAQTPISEERDTELVEIFLEEGFEILEHSAESLQRWLDNVDNLIEVEALQRDLHTLKGGARMAELREIGDLAHELEFLYEDLCNGKLRAVSELFELLNRCHDRLGEMLEAVREQKALAPATELIEAISLFRRNPAELLSVPTSVALHPAPEAPAEVDADILDIFLEEAVDLLEELEVALERWRSGQDAAPLADMLRVLHTLKGGARLAGQKVMGDLAHDLEQHLSEAQRQGAPWPESLYLDAQNGLEGLQKGVEQLRERMSVALASPSDGAPSEAQVPAPAPVVEKTLSVAHSPIIAAAPEQPAQAQQAVVLPFVQRARELAAQAAAHRAPQEMVKVPAELLEGLVNLAGETSIFRGRVEQQVSDFSFTLGEMESTIDRVRDQLRRLDTETQAQILSRIQAEAERAGYEDFDPLEMDRHSQLQQLSRALFESASDLLDLKETLAARNRDAETLLLQQARVNTELQEGLMRTRMVPFDRLVPRLRRIVRQVAGELHKEVDFQVANAEGEMDRSVMERIVAPLEHMLRNAVDHGIEKPEQRAAAGKPRTGHIQLSLSREGGDIVLRLRDDGAGVKLDAVRRKAIERGLMDAQSDLSDHEVLQFILEAGFSTAEKVTQISGRGVGMDVVHSEVKQLGGSMGIESTPGQGSTFTIRLPFTVSMNRALMVYCGEDLYAIPLNTIEGIVRVSPYELEAYYAPDAPRFEYAGQNYELKYLGELLDSGQQPKLTGQTLPLPVILVRSAEHAVAVQVDSLAGSREIVVKSLGAQFAAVHAVSGATILGDGRVVVIVDLLATIRARHARQLFAAPRLLRTVEQEEVAKVRPTLVMVVDDSVTVRKVTTRLLERNGMNVITAKDGVDAIAQLQDQQPDIMLLDIEMPRMDGFEVATLVRHDARLKNLPIIMITSRTGEKHRERAMAIGVNEYLGKPYQESLLLETITKLVSVHD